MGRGAEGRACEEFPEIGLAPARAAAVRGVRGVAGAAALLREALELDPNHAPALTALGRAHQAGEGVDADDATALDLFRRAANLGDAGKFFYFIFFISYGQFV